MSRPASTVLLLLLPLLAAGNRQRQIIADNPALHRLNDRVILEAFSRGDNEVVCTYCLFQVVSAAYQIGNDLIQREIRDALGSRDPKALSEALLDAADLLPTLNGTLTGYYQTGAFDQCPVRTKRDQCASIAALLRNRAEPVNFRDPRTKDRINADVERATAGKIRDLFASLPDKWVTRLTAVDDKFAADGRRNTITVPTLINEDRMPFLDADDGVQGVSMPYEDPAIRLYCFKAKDGGDIRPLLYRRHYLELAKAPVRYTQVRMPKFDLVSKLDSYVQFMELMGLREMFQGGLGPQDTLKVDQLVHKAVIQADEHGTSAAGAAGVSFIPLSAMPVEVMMRFDRPFICSLVHEELTQPLFTAYIADPRRQ
ncbi:Alpha-1-antiproteinase F [Amphibalanus amphitrite]|uniref:Alpha-1-antiproteinase F n=1 Tax=Amphibalanus amphitrite TaxID=1232801 RepID=A0A6A4W055_AMPAM|nr:Alpha-1-antiproteinase F [Amphibalanus amphitrite]